MVSFIAVVNGKDDSHGDWAGRSRPFFALLRPWCSVLPSICLHPDEALGAETLVNLALSPSRADLLGG